MEFYSISRAIVEQSATGFNSQRDGILLEFLSEKLTLFGFNSQRDGILPIFDKNFIKISISFNSQRDGILPRARL